MEEKKLAKEHKIILDKRAEGKLTGITDVYAFDEECISLMTENGKLQIRGEQLHVKCLDLEHGELEISGKINGVQYLTKKPKKKGDSFLKQFFR